MVCALVCRMGVLCLVHVFCVLYVCRVCGLCVEVCAVCVWYMCCGMMGGVCVCSVCECVCGTMCVVCVRCACGTVCVCPLCPCLLPPCGGGIDLVPLPHSSQVGGPGPGGTARLHGACRVCALSSVGGILAVVPLARRGAKSPALCVPTDGSADLRLSHGSVFQVVLGCR